MRNELADLAARVESIETNLWGPRDENDKRKAEGSMEWRLRLHDDRFDTLNTPLWKRVLFRLDGWGPWHTLRDAPRWRPWRRFYTS